MHAHPHVQFLQRGAISKYTEAEILNHSQLRHPHVIQFKVCLRLRAPPLPCAQSCVRAMTGALASLSDMRFIYWVALAGVMMCAEPETLHTLCMCW